MLKHLTEPSWRVALERHVSSPGFARLAQFAAKERTRGPPTKLGPDGTEGQAEFTRQEGMGRIYQ
eukprot:scaffold308552_cov54-Attheya_sp.AAC.1